MANEYFEAVKERFSLAKEHVIKQREHPEEEKENYLSEREYYYEGLYYLAYMFQEIIDILSRIEKDTAK